MLNSILPANEETEKLETVLRPVLNQLYFVGHNARSFIYGFPMADKEFQFIASQRGDLKEVQGRARILPAPDCELPDALYTTLTCGEIYVRAMPIDEYLLSSMFAGDAVAIHVQSGRMLCIPEYLTTQPTTQIRDERQFGLPENPLFKDAAGIVAHREALANFASATEKLAMSLSNGTPAQS